MFKQKQNLWGRAWIWTSNLTNKKWAVHHYGATLPLDWILKSTVKLHCNYLLPHSLILDIIMTLLVNNSWVFVGMLPRSAGRGWRNNWTAQKQVRLHLLHGLHYSWQDCANCRQRAPDTCYAGAWRQEVRSNCSIFLHQDK